MTKNEVPEGTVNNSPWNSPVVYASLCGTKKYNQWYLKTFPGAVTKLSDEEIAEQELYICKGCKKRLPA